MPKIRATNTALPASTTGALETIAITPIRQESNQEAPAQSAIVWVIGQIHKIITRSTINAMAMATATRAGLRRSIATGSISGAELIGLSELDVPNRNPPAIHKGLIMVCMAAPTLRVLRRVQTGTTDSNPPLNPQSGNGIQRGPLFSLNSDNAGHLGDCIEFL
jgi:hypothetical protein